MIVKELTIDIPYRAPRKRVSCRSSPNGNAKLALRSVWYTNEPEHQPIFYPLAGAAIIVLIWHYYVVLMQVSIVVLPTPLQVLKSMIDNARILTEEGWVTALECVYGFALSLAIGIPIAVVMTYSHIANQMFYPLLVASQSNSESSGSANASYLVRHRH